MTLLLYFFLLVNQVQENCPFRGRSTTCQTAHTLASIVLLAAIRRSLLAEQVRRDSASVVVEVDESEGKTPSNFFKIPCHVTMEAGAGVAFHEAQRMSEAMESDHETVKNQLKEANARLAQIVQEIVLRRNAGQRFEAHFWRDF